jgi:hypothetical protein
MPTHHRFIRARIGGVAFAVALFASSHAFADDIGDSPHAGARFTGPLVSGAPTMPAGLFNIEPYLIYNQVRGHYDDNGDRISQDHAGGWHLALPMQYGLTERVTLNAGLNAFHGENAFGDGTTRMGDATVGASFKLAQGGGHAKPSLTLAVRQNLPFGHHDRMELEPHELTTGSGAATTSIALHGQVYATIGGRTLRSRANLKWVLPHDGAGVHGASVYGTPAGFEGSVDLHGGSEATLGFEYAVNPRWVLATDVVHERNRGFEARGATASALVTTTRGASWRTSLAPAVEYHFNDNVGVIAGAFVSIAGRSSSAILAPQVAVNVAF